MNQREMKPIFLRIHFNLLSHLLFDIRTETNPRTFLQRQEVHSRWQGYMTTILLMLAKGLLWGHHMHHHVQKSWQVDLIFPVSPPPTALVIHLHATDQMIQSSQSPLHMVGLSIGGNNNRLPVQWSLDKLLENRGKVFKVIGAAFSQSCSCRWKITINRIQIMVLKVLIKTVYLCCCPSARHIGLKTPIFGHS